MVSDEAASVKLRADKVSLNGKFAPYVTLFTAIIAFSLSLVALTATGGSNLQKYDLLTLNTSTFLQNAIKVSDTESSTRRSVPTVIEDDSVPMPRISNRDIPSSPIQARQLPFPSDIESFFTSIGSAFTSAIDPAPPSATGSSSPGGSGSGASGFLQDLESLIQSLLGAATEAVGQEIVNVVNELVKEVLDALGIQDWYSLYMREFCSGSYSPSYNSPTAKRNSTKCTPLNEANSEVSKTNSTLQIGTTIIDFSALNLPNKLSSASSGIDSIFTAIFAIHVTGIVASGLLILITPLHIFLPFFQRFIFHLLIAALAGLATTCFGVIAGIETGIMIIIDVLVNGLGEGLGIEANRGGALLALLWMSFVLMGFSTMVWFLRWHTNRYVRRPKQDSVGERPLVKEAKSTYRAGGRR